MLQNLHAVAEKLATRINLRVGVLMTGKVIVQANQAHPEWFKFKFKTRRDNEMFPNCITLMRWDGSVLADHLNEDQKPKDFNKWVNFNSANWPDKLSPGAF